MAGEPTGAIAITTAVIGMSGGGNAAAGTTVGATAAAITIDPIMA